MHPEYLNGYFHQGLRLKYTSWSTSSASQTYHQCNQNLYLSFALSHTLNRKHIIVYRILRLELFKSIVKQDRTVYSIPHCDRFVYGMNHENIENIKAIMAFLSSAYRNMTLILKGHDSS